MPDPARQLRLVLTVDDLDAAIALYGDGLGLAELASFSDPEGRVVIYDVGRATLELADAGHAAYVDRVEGVTAAEGATGADDPATQPVLGVRVAFEVTDAAGTTRRLEAAGARLVAAPVRTPWSSLNARLASPEGLPITVFEEQPPG